MHALLLTVGHTKPKALQRGDAFIDMSTVLLSQFRSRDLIHLRALLISQQDATAS